MADAVTAKVLARHLGISVRRVRELRVAKVLPGAEGSPYNLEECVSAYCARLRPQCGASAAGGASAGSLTEERAENLRLQNEKLRIELDTASGELLRAGPTVARFAELVHRARDRMLNIPHEKAPEIYRCRSAAEVCQLLERVISDALEDLVAGIHGDGNIKEAFDA